MLVGKSQTLSDLHRSGLFQPLCTEVAHTVCKLFDILLAAEVLGRVVLADISDNARLPDYLRTQLVGVLFGNALDKAVYQTAKILQLARRSFIDVHPVGPVSYTQLDVYKRQALYKAARTEQAQARFIVGSHMHNQLFQK